MKSGVVVLTLTSTYYIGTIRETFTTRVGFAGEYNKKALSVAKKELKKLYFKRFEDNYKDILPVKHVCRVSAKTIECDILLSNK